MSDFLTSIRDAFDNLFVEQRRSIPKTYQFGNDIRSLSKKGIKYVIERDMAGITVTKKDILNIWDRMGDLQLPATFGGFQDFESAQELIEFFAVDAMFKAVLDGGTLSSVEWEEFSSEALKTTPQAWLFGLLDAGSELSRCVSRYIIKNKPTRVYRTAMRQRFLAIANELNDFLEHFTEVTPAVMDAYNKFGFRQSFRSKMNQLRGAIEYQMRLVEESIEHEED